MSSEEYTDAVLSCVNAARSEDGQLDLLELTSPEVNYAYDCEVLITLNEEDIQEGDSNVEKVVNRLKTLLVTEGDDREIMMAKSANYIMVEVTEQKDNTIEAVIKIFNKYLDIDEIGPFIDGSIVLQMSSHNAQELVPAICKIDFATDSDESFENVSIVMPWQMIYNPASGELPDSCSIPVSLDPQYSEGTVRLTIYMSPPQDAPHDEEVEGYSPNWALLIPAAVIQTTVNAAANNIENVNESLTYPAVLDLKISCSSNWEAELGQEGRQINRVDLAKGFNEFAEAGEWKFHVGVNTGSVQDSGGVGVEDVIFVRKEKGGEFDLPEGFTIDPSDILSTAPEGESSNYEVNLAYKLGPKPRYSWVLPMSCEDIDEKTAEASFQKYVDRLGGGAELRIAPPEVNQLHGFRVALLLVYKENDMAEAVFSGDGQAIEQSERDNGTGENDENQDDDVSKMTGDGFSSEDFSDEDDDEEEDTFALDEAATLQLQKKLQQLEAEKESHLSLNAELQKKCCAILARIGRDSQTRGGNDQDVMDPANSNENSSEKEGHFADCVCSISDGRARLLRQQSEYDQFALDLQGRLDDKEFKAEEIMDSLNEFKREIMLKAENSRTGQGISKRLIKHYEQTERKKDAELEKVRLRNISLKTTLRRLEKTLRSREQLAEGLHMIDFEQLKIENQTLSEKIEERNEELAKLKRKKTVTVQILTHIREKLRYVTTQNGIVREDLLVVDSQINKERSTLTSSKHDRDSIREDNIELKRQRGFATSDLLILDFEKRKQTIEELTTTVDELKERYFLLTQQIERNSKVINRTNNLKTKTSLPPI